jgi:WD40 repeat protein
MGQASPGKGERVSATENPFVGPRSFRTGEKLFGRQQETAELIDLLIAERIVLMSSPSGAGKSSLINAELIPRMRANGFEVFPTIRVNRSLPAAVGAPSDANRYLISLLMSLEESQSPEHRLSLDTLTQLSFETYLAGRTENASGERDSVLFVFDQFEEILTVDPTHREMKQDFFEQVGRALRNRKRWALFAMREEYVAALLPYAKSIPARLSTTFRLDLLSKRAAMEAIQEPARAAGTPFEPAAAEKLVQFLSLVRVQQLDGSTIEEPGEYVEPVQLQVVCRRMWETLPAGAATISLDHVLGVGRVERALADYYDDVLAAAARLPGGNERAIREWVEKGLITPTGIRGEVMQTAVASGGLANDIITKLVDSFLVRADERRGSIWYELAHDRLIEPIKSSNAAWFEKHLHPMQRQAELWHREGRPDRLLLRGADLREADAWTAANKPALTQAENDLLDRSAAQRRSDRVKRGSLVSFVVVLALLTLYSVYERSQAVQQRNEAVRQRNAALLTQSRHLSDIADAQMEAGDPVTSMLIAMAGLPDVDAPASDAASGRPYLPALEGRLYAAYLENHERVVLSGHEGPVGSAAFSADGVRVATASDQSIRVWDAATGEMLTRIPVPSAVSAIAFMRDDTRILSGEGTMLRIYDARTGALAADPMEQKANILSVAVNLTGKRIIVGLDDGTARVWDATAGREIALLEGSGSIGSVTVSHDGNVVAGASSDPRAMVWRVPAPRVDMTIPAVEPTQRLENKLTVSGVALNGDAKRLVTGSYDRSVKVWDLSTGENPLAELKPTAELKDLDQPVTSVALNEAGTHVAIGLQDGSVRLWEIARGTQTVQLNAHAAAVKSVAFARDGSRFVSGSDDGSARIWSTQPGADGAVLHLGSPVTAEAASADGARFVTSSDRVAQIWASKSRHPLFALPHDAEVSDVAMSQDGTRVVTGTRNGNVTIWDATNGLPLRELPQHPGAISSLAMSADAPRIATGSEDKNVRIFDATSGALIKQIGPLASRIARVVFGPAKDQIATGAGTTARIWNFVSGNQVAPPRILPGAVLAVSISPDGRWFAAGGRQDAIILWHLGSDEPPQALKTSGAAITSISFDREGRRLIAGDGDGRLWMWNAASGELVANTKIHSDAIVRIAAAARSVITASIDGTVRTSPYFSDQQGLISDAKRRMPRCLTPEQMKRFHLDPTPPRWCIAGPDRQWETDASKWRPLWPYQAKQWRDWQIAKDREKAVPLPEM